MADLVMTDVLAATITATTSAWKEVTLDPNCWYEIRNNALDGSTTVSTSTNCVNFSVASSAPSVTTAASASGKGILSSGSAPALLPRGASRLWLRSVGGDVQVTIVNIGG